MIKQAGIQHQGSRANHRTPPPPAPNSRPLRSSLRSLLSGFPVARLQKETKTSRISTCPFVHLFTQSVLPAPLGLDSIRHQPDPKEALLLSKIDKQRTGWGGRGRGRIHTSCSTCRLSISGASSE